jgi:alcohol dehydrogenase (cytochrome c)
MQWRELPPDQPALLTGIEFKMQRTPDSDGMVSHLTAINLESRKIAWVKRETAALTTGTLATAGGVVFAGSVDRRFKAYDDATGKVLWQTRLNDVPSSAPISYSADGRQYVAMVVGCCGVQASDAKALTTEARTPPDGGAAVWVFELPSGE